MAEGDDNKMQAIVTVKLPRDSSHDPRNKKSGKCPLFKEYAGSFLCTDVTGSHHSYIEHGDSLMEIRKNAEKKFGHVTRIETQ